MTGRHVIGAVVDNGPGAVSRRDRVELVRGGPLSAAKTAALVAVLAGRGTSGMPGSMDGSDAGGSFGANGGFETAGVYDPQMASGAGAGAGAGGEPQSAWRRAAIAEGTGARVVTSAPFVPAPGWRS